MQYRLQSNSFGLTFMYLEVICWSFQLIDCNFASAFVKDEDVKAREIEGYTVRALPTRQWGYVVITTPDGVLDHEEARLFSLDIFAIQTLWKGREEFFNGVAACKNVSNF
ncbi:hypothetical protein WN944_029474 [Citrus x changshan-huyou]|uniref:Uncharacterized protein n=1 Tax=Citrus x changshan-huyou TaxID=2935761 RepID=A0AAP0Q9V4_9ROSI